MRDRMKRLMKVFQPRPAYCIALFDGFSKPILSMGSDPDVKYPVPRGVPYEDFPEWCRQHYPNAIPHAMVLTDIMENKELRERLYGDDPEDD